MSGNSHMAKNFAKATAMTSALTQRRLALLLGCFALLLLAGAVLVGLPARGGTPEHTQGGFVSTPDDAELAKIFARFNHKRHQGVLAARGVGCSSCHQIGTTGDPRIAMSKVESVVLPPPAKACHFCHNPPTGEQPIGTGRCITCHDKVMPPDSHGAGWIDLHGTEARLQTWSCDNCHRRSFCIDCHERKEAVRYRVHDGAWLTIHPIAARTDPSQCGTCHLQAECESCHTSSDGRLR